MTMILREISCNYWISFAESLTNSLWQKIPSLCDISLFIILPFSYLYQEASGFLYKGSKGRFYETFIVLMLFITLLLSVINLFKAIIGYETSFFFLNVDFSIIRNSIGSSIFLSKHFFLYFLFLKFTFLQKVLQIKTAFEERKKTKAFVIYQEIGTKWKEIFVGIVNAIFFVYIVTNTVIHHVTGGLINPGTAILFIEFFLIMLVFSSLPSLQNLSPLFRKILVSSISDFYRTNWIKTNLKPQINNTSSDLLILNTFLILVMTSCLPTTCQLLSLNVSFLLQDKVPLHFFPSLLFKSVFLFVCVYKIKRVLLRLMLQSSSSY